MPLELRLADFENIKHGLSASNKITKSELKGAGQVLLIEFNKHGMVMHLEKKICSEGHLLMVQISPEGGLKKIFDPFHVTGIVTRVEILNVTSGILIDFKLNQYPQQLWKKIQELYSDRQDHVNLILSQLGDELNGSN